MSGTIKGSSKRIERISRLFVATAQGSTDVAQRSRFLRARRGETGANQPTRAGERAGEILLAHRPVFLLDTPPFSPAAADLAELAAARDDLATVAARAAPSVGLVEVERDGAFQPVGTCFRVAGGPSRIVTSGHLMRDILAPGAQIRRGFEYRLFKSGGRHLPTRVRFPDGMFTLATVLCAHPVWDLMVGDLEAAGAAVPPLAVETDLHAPGADGDIVAIIGFPLAASDVTQPDELELLLHGKLGRQCLSPGRAGPLAPVARPLPKSFSGQDHWLGHDATTLPGNSGSPVISLSTGRVVAVHGHGGHLDRFDRTRIADLNGAVPLALVCTEEDAMRVLISGPAGSPSPPPRLWEALVPTWHPRGESVPAAAGSVALSAVRPDRSDFRDFLYRPSLIRPQDCKLPLSASGIVRDQGGEASCVGCALATAIGEQLSAIGRKETVVSARMLYEAAREHDEFLDDGKGGTSLRGAIKGFFHNGACLERTAPYRPGETNWSLGIEAATEAGDVALGAYYKVEPRLSDTQLAICEAGAVVVSARIHRNWLGKLPDGRIHFRPGSIGTHAFVLLGYDDRGFILQNSWGATWGLWNGQPGLAHWSYEDWAENIIDTWVLQLAPRAPGTLDLRARGTNAPPPSRLRRSSILGHVVQTEQHGIVRSGGLSPGLASLRETAVFLASKVDVPGKKPRDGTKYTDIAVFLHDPLLDADAPGQLVKALVEPFKKQKIYPFHIFHGLDAARSFMARMDHEARSATDRYRLSGEELTSWLNSRAPAAGAGVLALLTGSAAAAAQPGGAVHEVLAGLMSETLAAGQVRRVHLIGLGLGSVLAQELARTDRIPVASLTLVDPVGDSPVLLGAVARTNAVQPANAALQGYRGSWTTLARATLADRSGFLDARDRLSAATIADAAFDGSLAEFVLASITGSRP
jgi:hypothetical protein